MTKREYESTHSWITFRVDLARIPVRSWVLLGQSLAQCQQITNVPLLPSAADELHVRYLAKGIAATTAIEGNTLSEEEVSRLVRGVLKLPPSKEYLGIEVNNILQASNDILDDLSHGRTPPITLGHLLRMNQRVLKGLALDPDIDAGRIRTHSVVVGRYRGAPAQDCEYLLARLCEWLTSPDFQQSALGLVGSAILRAIIAHIYLAWIHPFGDGNGRTARLLEYQIMVSCGVSSLAAHLLSNHYNETRAEYYRQLDRSSRTGSSIEFIQYALQGFVDALHAQVETIREHQWRGTWENYVLQSFEHRNSPSDIRKLHLALDLAGVEGPIMPAGLRLLTPRLAAAYAGTTAKTLTRDINALETMGLIRRTSKGVIANTGVVRAFGPLSGEPDIPIG